MYIFLESDAFARQLSDKASDTAIGHKTSVGKAPVRRPFRGVQIKEDRYSIISIRTAEGKSIRLTSSSAFSTDDKGRGSVEDYADYILQGLEDQRMEKQQIIETFGEPYVYFFGERPRVITVRGQLINTEDFNWRSQFWYNYDKYLRGTKLVQANARVYLSYDTVVIEGYPLQANAADDSGQPYSVPFSMSLLVTGYFDYSEIGQVRFPDYGQQVNLTAVNSELEQRRMKFTSTGAEVRAYNLTATPTGGILSTIRSGIRAVNDVIGQVSGYVDAIHNFFGGRNVRVPIGIAGFLHATGNAQIAAGSISSTEIETLMSAQYDAKTGTFKSVSGSVKLRMPGNAKFAPPWTSKISAWYGSSRGAIHENIDEYVQAGFVSWSTLEGEGTGKLEDLVGSADYLMIKSKIEERQLRMQDYEFRLGLKNIEAEAGGWIADLANGVSFLKSNFGMIMTAASFIEDPLSVTKAAFGIGVGTQSSSRLSDRKYTKEQQEIMDRYGLKVSSDAGGTTGIGRYIGATALSTFSNMAERIGDTSDWDGSGPPPESAAIGDVYQAAPYAGYAPTADNNYEAVYGDNDYDALANNDPAAFAAFDEAYGDNDNAPGGSDIGLSTLEDVYGAGGYSSPSTRSPEDIAQVLQDAQSGAQPTDETTKGIRGEADIGTDIRPVI